MSKGNFIQSYNVYECCGTHRSHGEMQKHLSIVHHIPDTTALKAEKKLLKQRDGLEWTEAVYEWKLEDGTKFKQFVKIHKK
jgi:hypothetical protein